MKYGIGIHSQNGRFVMPYYGHADQVIAVRTDSNWAGLGGNRVDLGARPFVVEGVLYVPLARLVRAMNGQIEFKKKTMRFWYKLPA